MILCMHMYRWLCMWQQRSDLTIMRSMHICCELTLRRTLIVKRMAQLCIFINLTADPEVALPHNARLFHYLAGWVYCLCLLYRIWMEMWVNLAVSKYVTLWRLPLNIRPSNYLYGNDIYFFYDTNLESLVWHNSVQTIKSTCVYRYCLGSWLVHLTFIDLKLQHFQFYAAQIR